MPTDRRALILVVERDRHVRALERFFLEKAGFAVEFADDGRRGVELARKLQPSILITEILIPGMDGLGVCRCLKSEPATRGITVLIFSILAAEERAREAGADGFLHKPIDDVLLVETVEKLIRSHGRTKDQ